MKNRILKAFLCAILAIAVIVSSSIGFGAVITDETNEIIIYDETITLKNNEVYISSYNITENYQGSLALSADNKADSIVVKGTDFLGKAKKMSTKAGVVYEFNPGVGTSAIGGISYKYDTTGGVYRKVRAKLSRYYFFNEDGSHTTKEFTKGSVKNYSVSIVDVTKLQLYIAKYVEFDRMQQYRADVDYNNNVSILDATKIQLYLASKSK